MTPPRSSRLLARRASAALLLALLLALPLTQSACHIPGWSDAGLARDAAEEIFGWIRAGQIEKVYQTAAPEFQDTMPIAAFEALMAAFDQQLGLYKSHELVNTTVRSQMGGEGPGSRVVLTYRIVRDRGALDTTLVFRIEKPREGGGRLARLEQYVARDAPASGGGKDNRRAT